MGLTKEDVLNLFNNCSTSVYNEIPKDDVFRVGQTTYFLSKNSVKDIRDLSFDSYSPWNGKDSSGNTQKTRTEKWTIKLINDIFFFDKSGDLILKKSSSIHCRELNLRRYIWTVLNANNQLCSDALYVYQAEVDLIPPECANKKIIPSTSAVFREALKYRTTTFAKRILTDEGFRVTSTQLSSVGRSVPSMLKKKTGPKPVTNYHEIFDRFMNRNINEIEMNAPLIEKNSKNKVCIRAVVAYVNAFKNFCADLPTFEEAIIHHQSVDKLDLLNEKDCNRYFESFLIHESPSCTLPCGATLVLDTTFDLAYEYVTVACGYTEFFKNNKSKKNSTLILGYMLHTEKTFESHTYFAEFLNSMFLKYAPDKTLNCIIHDGEDSFRAYSSGSFLSKAITLRCDIHRLANIKECVKESNVSVKEAQALFFGEKRRTSSSTFLKKGLLQALTRNEYNKLYHALLQKLDGKLKEWLVHNKESLYMHNSMRKKLLAGVTAQYASTNVLEARNAQFKQLITRKEKSEKVMDVMLHIHRDEMNERLKAAISEPSTLECSDSLNREVWRKACTTDRRLFLSRFGLENLVVPSKCDRLPSWILEEILTDTDSLLKIVNSSVLHTSNTDSNLFFLVDSTNMSCVMLRKEAERLLCYKDRCLKKKKLCVHIITTSLFLPDDELKVFLHHEEKKRNDISLNEMFKSSVTNSDGSKTVRRGKPSSAGNYSRNYQYLINDSTESVQNQQCYLEFDETVDSDNDFFD